MSKYVWSSLTFCKAAHAFKKALGCSMSKAMKLAGSKTRLDYVAESTYGTTPATPSFSPEEFQVDIEFQKGTATHLFFCPLCGTDNVSTSLRDNESTVICHECGAEAEFLWDTRVGQASVGQALLTRGQAIKRINDIRHGSIEDHHCHPTHPLDAVITELMAIFDIKEEELK